MGRFGKGESRVRELTPRPVAFYQIPESRHKKKERKQGKDKQDGETMMY